MSDKDLIAKYGGSEFSRPDINGFGITPWGQAELAQHPYYRRQASNFNADQRADDRRELEQLRAENAKLKRRARGHR